MAIGLVILAGLISLPIAGGAWLMGYVSMGQALLLYILAGWAVIAAGFLSALFSVYLKSASSSDTADTGAVPLKVKSVNRG